MCDEPDAECGRRETYKGDGRDVSRAGYFRVTKA
jgi:hypothetical protein